MVTFQRMDAIQTAILKGRIKYLKSVIKKRRSIAKLYFQKYFDLRFRGKIWVYTYHLFVIRTKKEKINKLLKIKRNDKSSSNSNTQAI